MVCFRLQPPSRERWWRKLQPELLKTTVNWRAASFRRRLWRRLAQRWTKDWPRWAIWVILLSLFTFFLLLFLTSNLISVGVWAQEARSPGGTALLWSGCPDLPGWADAGTDQAEGETMASNYESSKQTIVSEEQCFISSKLENFYQISNFYETRCVAGGRSRPQAAGRLWGVCQKHPGFLAEQRPFTAHRLPGSTHEGEVISSVLQGNDCKPSEAQTLEVFLFFISKKKKKGIFILDAVVFYFDKLVLTPSLSRISAAGMGHRWRGSDLWQANRRHGAASSRHPSSPHHKPSDSGSAQPAGVCGLGQELQGWHRCSWAAAEGSTLVLKKLHHQSLKAKKKKVPLSSEILLLKVYDGLFPLLLQAVEGLLDATSGADADLLIRYRECHLLVLKALQDGRAYGPQWCNKQITRWGVEPAWWSRSDFRCSCVLSSNLWSD